MATATVPREKPAAIAPPASPIIVRIPVDQVDVGANVRTDVGDLAELVESIRQHGILQPIKVRGHVDNGRFELVFGQRRLLAAREAGLTHITAVVEPGSLPVARAITQLVENLQRQDLGPLEEARAFRQLIQADNGKLTQAELARQIGRSAPYVSNALRILELDPKVLPLVESGQLSGGHAKALASLKGPAQREMAGNAAKDGWSVHETERYVQQYHERQQRESEQIEQLAQWAEEAEAALIEKGADKKSTTLTTLEYSYGVERHLKALKARGWKTVERSWSRGKCECTALGVSRTWEGKTQIVRRCIVEAHYTAKSQAEGKRQTLSWAEQSKVYAEAERIRKRIHAGMQPILVEALQQLPERVARALLWSLMDYSLNDWVRDHKGDRKKPDAWGELCDLDAKALAGELTRFLLKGFSDRYGVKLDWPAIAEAFGVDLAAPTPKPKRGGSAGRFNTELAKAGGARPDQTGAKP